MADVRGTVATYTVDHLAFSLSPPMVGAVIDFDGGGRYRGEMTDVDPEAVAVGTRVEMTFRRLYTRPRCTQLLLEGSAAVLDTAPAEPRAASGAHEEKRG